MARYIDAEELLNKRPFTISGGKPSEYLEGFLDCVDEAKEAINNTPTADVAEVKHGEWEIKSETRRFFEEIDEELYVECPFCHRGFYVPFEFEDEKILKYAKENYPYCHCGAKMDGKKEGTT